MKPERVEILRQGMIAGVLGYAVVAAFFAVLNFHDGHSIFRTASVLGSVLFYGLRDIDLLTVSAVPVLAFKPFLHFFASWMPPRLTDLDYVIAHHDGAVAYLDEVDVPPSMNVVLRK